MKKKVKQTYSIPMRLQKVAGIDCHQSSYKVAVCKEGGAPLVFTFGAFTDDVEKLKDLLVQHSI